MTSEKPNGSRFSTISAQRKEQQKCRQRKLKAVSPLGRRLHLGAEGMGLEPTTPFGAPHFQCGR